MARAAARLTGRRDLSGRTVAVQRTEQGLRFAASRKGQVHHRQIADVQVFRFDDEWLFTEVRPDDPVPA